MNRRAILAVGGFLLLVSLAGCTALTGVTSDSGLAANESYDWNADADVVIDLGDGAYRAIHRIENRSSVDLYQQSRYGIENPIGVRAVKFRHENGTIVNASAMSIDESRSDVTVELPAEHGQLAYTAPKRSNEFTTPVFTDGSYLVKIPPGHDVENFVLGTVRPRGADTAHVGDRVHVSWDDLSGGSIRINYYLTRDVYLLGGLLISVVIVGGLGIGYVYRQIKQLRRRREELGIDVDLDDGDGRDPPPGMR